LAGSATLRDVDGVSERPVSAQATLAALEANREERGVSARGYGLQVCPLLRKTLQIPMFNYLLHARLWGLTFGLKPLAKQQPLSDSGSLDSSVKDWGKRLNRSYAAGLV
jgi:hypothetical protein